MSNDEYYTKKYGSPFKVYVTKYALTKGVYVTNGYIDGNSDMCIAIWPGALTGTVYCHGDDWHVTKEDALSRVNEMVAARKKSIQKQLAKFEKLEKDMPFIELGVDHEPQG